jgi:molecular chaperone GrpE
MKKSSPDLKKNGYVKKSMNGTSAEDTKTGTETEQNETASPEPAKAAPEAAQLEEAKKQVENYKDMLLRKAAEFENYKRRTENEMASAFKYAGEDILGELLPVMDDFERSLKHGRESTDYDALLKGIEMIYQKLSKVLEGRGVKAFETEGREFNVDFHDAMLQSQRADVQPNTVIQEVEKGYMLKDKVLRHAKVVVSTAPMDSMEEHSDAPEEE